MTKKKRHMLVDSRLAGVSQLGYLWRWAVGILKRAGIKNRQLVYSIVNSVWSDIPPRRLIKTLHILISTRVLIGPSMH